MREHIAPPMRWHGGDGRGSIRFGSHHGCGEREGGGGCCVAVALNFNENSERREGEGEGGTRLRHDIQLCIAQQETQPPPTAKLLPELPEFV